MSHSQDTKHQFVPFGAKLIILAGGISFINAVANYPYSLHYHNYGSLGFLAMAIHAIHALALILLGIHFNNKSDEKFPIICFTVISLIATWFIFHLKTSNSPFAIEMMEWDSWRNPDSKITFGSSKQYLFLLVATLINAILVEFKRDDRTIIDVIVFAGVQIFFSLGSNFNETAVGITLAHVGTYVLVAIGFILCAGEKSSGKWTIWGSAISATVFKKILIAVLVLTLILIPISLSFTGGGNSGGYGKSLSDNYGHDKYDAIVIAETQVKSNLKVPSTAEFCSNSEYSVSCAGNTWTVKGYVDAQNVLGVFLRNNFTVQFEFTSGSKYTVISCNIE